MTEYDLVFFIRAGFGFFIGFALLPFLMVVTMGIIATLTDFFGGPSR